MPAITVNEKETLPATQHNPHKTFWYRLSHQKELVIMSVPLLIYVIIFSYVPLYGWLMAFQNYKPGFSILNQEWVGFQQFRFLFTQQDFLRVLRNTIGMSVINLVLGFVTSIGFALLLNEIRNVHIKKPIQTISYLPYFISWVITAGIVSSSLSMDGIVNRVLVGLHIIPSPVQWLANGPAFWWILAFANIWKNLGFSAIIYLGAMAGIDPALYESAQLDGASRWQKMRYITLPGIKSTFVILLIMSAANILNAGFEPQYLLATPTNMDWSQTIDVFVMKYGINLGNYSLSVAAGMFKTVVSVILLFICNTVCAKLGEDKLI